MDRIDTSRGDRKDRRGVAEPTDDLDKLSLGFLSSDKPVLVSESEMLVVDGRLCGPVSGSDDLGGAVAASNSVS